MKTYYALNINYSMTYADTLVPGIVGFMRIYR